MPSYDVERIVNIGPGIRGFTAERAASPAERRSKGFMTVFSENLRPVIPGNLLSSPIEKKDFPLFIVGNYSFHKTVEDPLQIRFISEKIFQFSVHWILLSPYTRGRRGLSYIKRQFSRAPFPIGLF